MPRMLDEKAATCVASPAMSNVMRNAKRYTNQTFTKRVDHEGGEHRASRALKEPAWCEKCGAVYMKRRWFSKNFIAGNRYASCKSANPTTCPACRQIEEGIAGGYVSLGGDFFKTHREEIERLLKNEAQRALEDNPLSRVISWGEQADGKATIETTTEHLAERFGHALKKAFRGEVKYDFSHENKVARVYWHRD